MRNDPIWMTPVRFIGLALVLSCLGFTEPARAQGSSSDAYKPISLGLFPPVQIVNENLGVKGFRFSLIYGKNTAVKGLDIGLVNTTSVGPDEGVQWGLVGLSGGDFTGAQLNAVNVVQGTATGVQLGWVNVTGHGQGVMIGLVNHANTMNGLQIGLINIIKQGGFLPVFPIVNWSF